MMDFWGGSHPSLTWLDGRPDHNILAQSLRVGPEPFRLAILVLISERLWPTPIVTSTISTGERLSVKYLNFIVKKAERGPSLRS